MIKFNRITTKTGDAGTSALYNGERRKKNDPVFQALGEIDELGAVLGLMKVTAADFSDTITEIQKCLLKLGAQTASPEDSSVYKKIEKLTESDLSSLEKHEELILDNLDTKTGFTLPGKNMPAAHAHLARTVCRRTERRLVEFAENDKRKDLSLCLKYINRLSDFLYAVSRVLEEKEPAK